MSAGVAQCGIILKGSGLPSIGAKCAAVGLDVIGTRSPQPRDTPRLDEEELADWHAGRNAVYQLAALTVGARLAVADA